MKRAVEEINPRYTEQEVEQEVELIKQEKESESMADLEGMFDKDTGNDEPVNE